MGVIRVAHCARDLKNPQPCGIIMPEFRLIVQKKSIAKYKSCEW
jgi:hypothetical protein